MSAQPAVWAIGDVQGCHQALSQLLAHPDVAADADTRFWFCGDLINRGPESRAVLDRVMALGDRAVTVLGNHDLHFLGVAAGIRKTGKSDTFHDILAAPDVQRYIDWLRERPLVWAQHGHVLVHAGILPAWTLDQALALAAEVQAVLRGPDWARQLADLYGNKPRRWRPELQGAKRLRIVINAMTRMRMCRPDGRLDFNHKGEPQWTDDVVPWFDVAQRAASDHTIVFGHWSALGLLLRPNLIGLDTGCVWGRQLTAVRLHDRKVVQVACHPAQSLGSA